MLHKKTCRKIASDILCIEVQEFNTSDIFCKIQNLKKLKMKAVVPFLPKNLKLHSPMVINGKLWSKTVNYGQNWSFTVIHGHLRSYTVNYGQKRSITVKNGQL